MVTVLRVYCVMVGALAVAYLVVPTQVENVLYLVVSVAVIAAVAWGIHRHQPQVRLPWLLLAAGLTCSLLGDVGFTVFESVAGEVPFPSFADGLYLLFYPLLFLMIGRFLAAVGTPDRTAWVDASIWTIGVAALLWEPLIRPAFAAADGDPLATTVAVLYPLLDLGLLLMVLRVVVGLASPNRSYILLAAALLLQVGVDATYGIRATAGLYRAGEPLDIGWMLVNLLIGAAALHPSMALLTLPTQRPSRRSTHHRLQALLIPSLIPAGLLAFRHIGPGDDVDSTDVVMALAVAVLLVLIVARGGGLLRLADLRSGQLRDRTEALESALADRERITEQLRVRVDHDPLTGLSSRSRFAENVDRALNAWCEGGGPAPSVAFLDLDDFKSINDTLGHEAGDLLLQELGDRMRAQLGPDQVVSRLGGDEFAVLIHDCPELIVERLLTALQQPVSLAGRSLRPQVSIGVTTAQSPRDTTSDLLREADVAMYAAKRTGGGWRHYQPSMSAALLERLDVRDRLVQAVRDGAVEPWFQPVVDLASGALRGFEALARWYSNGVPAMPSVDWLRLAEETGIIVDVDRAVLRAAVAQLAAWRVLAPGSELEMAINLSARTLQQTGIEDEVLSVLRGHGVPAQLLTVEVTEGVLIEDEQVGERLRRLRAAGVQIGLDDFGTGWASLNYLRRFPVDHLKLDRTFTADLGRGAVADAIPAAIVQLARGLSLGVIAEGVETIEQRDRLIALGFEIGQGYLYGRAQKAADLDGWVRATAVEATGEATPAVVLRLAR